MCQSDRYRKDKIEREDFIVGKIWDYGMLMNRLARGTLITF